MDIQVEGTKIKGIQVGKLFARTFCNKIFDRSEDQLHQIWALYGLKILR